ncbi:MAG: TrmH family RNA methyltransferase [Lachnospiraceae bacterium]|nr:TrmH family RNA methyltransferase [Lachnospiraceae bacterium]
MDVIKPYKRGCGYSYALGAFPTFELLRKRPKSTIGVFVHSTFPEKERVEALCEEEGIPVWYNDKAIARLSDKENVFVIGVFRTSEQRLNPENPHVMLVNPSNMGNLGTILRTCLAYGIHDLAIIAPGVDWLNPKVVRASMGAIFSMRIAMYDSFEEYVSFASGVGREYFPFMLNGGFELSPVTCPKPKLFTLVYGNEATGLPAVYAEVGTAIKIPQSDEVDSLNLTIAVGIGLFCFRGGNVGKE